MIIKGVEGNLILLSLPKERRKNLVRRESNLTSPSVAIMKALYSVEVPTEFVSTPVIINKTIEGSNNHHWLKSSFNRNK